MMVIKKKMKIPNNISLFHQMTFTFIELILYISNVLIFYLLLNCIYNFIIFFSLLYLFYTLLFEYIFNKYNLVNLCIHYPMHFYPFCHSIFDTIKYNLVCEIYDIICMYNIHMLFIPSLVFLYIIYYINYESKIMNIIKYSKYGITLSMIFIHCHSNNSTTKFSIIIYHLYHLHHIIHQKKKKNYFNCV